MKVEVCNWKTCSWKFSKYIIKRLENDTEKFWYKNLEIDKTACMWWCKRWPNVKINNWNIINYSEAAKIGIQVQNQLQPKK